MAMVSRTSVCHALTYLPSADTEISRSPLKHTSSKPLPSFPRPVKLLSRRNDFFKCRASRWAERLTVDFDDPNHASSNIAVLPPERKFTLPIDFYKVLGAETHFLGDGIRIAYEAAVRRQPHEGYSEDTLRGRKEILRSACETLANPRPRGDYNQGLIEDEARTLMRDVPLDKVPGALCLLQEVGEMEVVIQAGRKLLQEQLPKTFRRDVILAMALSYIDISREAISEGDSDIIKSCEALERALQLLQEGGGKGLASDLQEQIDETLEEISPRYVLELLALPLDEKHRSKREEGLQRVRTILWTVGGGGAVAPIAGFTREEFMNEAFLRMKAAEQVNLFSSTPSNIPAESFEVYSVALAHIAEGFVGKKPHLIQEADSLFFQLQQTDGSNDELDEFSPPNQQFAFALERGMCALLLGELESCQYWLGLDDVNSPYRDPPIIDFVLANSDEDDSILLPGLCKLLESWLTEIVFPRFKDTQGHEFKLRDYYDDSSVLSFLESLERGKGSPLKAAAAIAKIGAGAGAAIDSVKTNAIQALKKVFPLAKKHFAKPSTPKMSTDFVLEPVPVVSSSIKDTFEESKGSGNDPDDFLDDSINSPSLSVGGFSGISGIVEQELPTLERGKFSIAKIAGTSIIIGALVFAGMKYSRGRYSLSTAPSNSQPSATVNFSSTESLNKDDQKMDTRLAENVVRKWQMIKSQALGPKHDVSQLSEILDGEMLKIWLERANEIAEHGWFWEYSLLCLTIESVTISRDGKRAMVEVTLQEAASLIDTNHPEHNDSYRSTYTTRYEIKNVNGTWKITDGAVLRS